MIMPKLVNSDKFLNLKTQIQATLCDRVYNLKEFSSDQLLALGSKKYQRGSYREAADYFALALLVVEGADSEELLWSSEVLSLLGEALQHTFGNDGTAINQAHMLLARQMERISLSSAPISPHTRARLLSQMGDILYDKGHFVAAAEHLEEARGILEAADGAEEDALAHCLTSLGRLRRDMKSFAEALILLNHARELRERLYGSHHPLTAFTFNSLGRVYLELGNVQVARDYFNRALISYNQLARSIGAPHPDEGLVWNNLGRLYQKQTNYAQAIECYQHALKIYTGAFTHQHPDIAATYNNLAKIYLVMGQDQDAQCYVDKARQIRETLLGKEHPDTIATIEVLGDVFLRFGKPIFALECYEQALEHVRVTSDYWQETALLNRVASCHRRLGDLPRATELFQHALELARSIGNRATETEALVRLGTCLRRQGGIEEGIVCYREAIELSHQFNQPITEIDALLALGLALATLNDDAEAFSAYESAAHKATKCSDMWGLLAAFNRSAVLCLDRQEMDAARNWCHQAEAHLPGIEELETKSEVLLTRAMVELAQGRLQDALIAIEQANFTDQPYILHRVIIVRSIILLRLQHLDEARKSFHNALQRVDDLIHLAPRNVEAHDIRGLAFCGLTLLDESKYISKARDAFAQARAISRAPGLVRTTSRLLADLLTEDFC